MNIQFDDNINQKQAQGIILLLTSLFPALNNSQPLSPSASQLSDPAPAPSATAGPTLVPESTPEATRKRRTKAEIAADEAAAKQTANPTESIESQPTGTAKPTTVSADELRTLLNTYIAAHSMEEAIAILQAFGCGRVTEALALEPAKLNELAAKLRG
jgi:hypothetical protein